MLNKWKRTKKTFQEKKGYNPFLLFRLQPGGNLKLNDERYIKTGDGYCSCIHIYEFPADNGDFWISGLTNETGVYTVIDVGTQPDEETTANLNRSLAELDALLNMEDSPSQEAPKEEMAEAKEEGRKSSVLAELKASVPDRTPRPKTHEKEADAR